MLNTDPKIVNQKEKTKAGKKGGGKGRSGEEGKMKRTKKKRKEKGKVTFWRGRSAEKLREKNRIITRNCTFRY